MRTLTTVQAIKAIIEGESLNDLSSEDTTITPPANYVEISECCSYEYAFGRCMSASKFGKDVGVFNASCKILINMLSVPGTGENVFVKSGFALLVACAENLSDLGSEVLACEVFRLAQEGAMSSSLETYRAAALNEFFKHNSARLSADQLRPYFEYASKQSYNARNDANSNGIRNFVLLNRLVSSVGGVWNQPLIYLYRKHFDGKFNIECPEDLLPGSKLSNGLLGLCRDLMGIESGTLYIKGCLAKDIALVYQTLATISEVLVFEENIQARAVFKSGASKLVSLVIKDLGDKLKKPNLITNVNPHATQSLSESDLESIFSFIVKLDSDIHAIGNPAIEKAATILNRQIYRELAFLGDGDKKWLATDAGRAKLHHFEGRVGGLALNKETYQGFTVKQMSWVAANCNSEQLKFWVVDEYPATKPKVFISELGV